MSEILVLDARHTRCPGNAKSAAAKQLELACAVQHSSSARLWPSFPCSDSHIKIEGRCARLLAGPVVGAEAVGVERFDGGLHLRVRQPKVLRPRDRRLGRRRQLLARHAPAGTTPQLPCIPVILNLKTETALDVPLQQHHVPAMEDYGRGMPSLDCHCQAPPLQQQGPRSGCHAVYGRCFKSHMIKNPASYCMHRHAIKSSA